MIVVKVRENSLSIDGHAGYAEKGKDIICAAVSALAQGLLRSLQALTDDEISAEVGSGRIKIEYENLSEGGKLLVDSFFIAISDIQETNGDVESANKAVKEAQQAYYNFINRIAIEDINGE